MGRITEIYIPGYGRVVKQHSPGIEYSHDMRTLGARFGGMGSATSYLQHLFLTVQGLDLHPFSLGLTRFEQVGISWNRDPIVSFRGAKGLLGILQEKRINPDLLTAVFNIINNNAINLWTDSNSEVFDVNVANVHKLQREEIEPRGLPKFPTSQEQAYLTSRTKSLIDGLTIEFLIRYRIVSVRKVPVQEAEAAKRDAYERCITATHRARLLAHEARTGQTFLDI